MSIEGYKLSDGSIAGKTISYNLDSGVVKNKAYYELLKSKTPVDIETKKRMFVVSESILSGNPLGIFADICQFRQSQ